MFLYSFWQPREAAAMRTNSEVRLPQRLDVLYSLDRLSQEGIFFWEVCLVRLEGVTSVWWIAHFHLSLPHPVKWNCDSGRCNVLLENSFWFRLSFLSSVSCVEQFSLYQKNGCLPCAFVLCPHSILSVWFSECFLSVFIFRYDFLLHLTEDKFLEKTIFYMVSVNR